jgi:hypothetical protein
LYSLSLSLSLSRLRVFVCCSCPAVCCGIMISSRSIHCYYYDALRPQIGNASLASRYLHTSSRGLRLELTGRNAVLQSEKGLCVCRLNRPRGFAKPLGKVAVRFGVVGWDRGLLWSGLGLVWSGMLDCLFSSSEPEASIVVEVVMLLLRRYLSLFCAIWLVVG